MLFAAIPQMRKRFSILQEEFFNGVNKRQTLAFIIGGGILGVGMALAGAVRTYALCIALACLTTLVILCSALAW